MNGAISLEEEGHIVTSGDITDAYADDIKGQLAAIPPTVKTIVHHISSGGGSVYAGYEGYQILQAARKAGKKIKAVIEGQAQSMATFIALASDEVVMVEPGVWMIHNPFFRNGLAGDADAYEKASKELRLIEDVMATAYSGKMKKSIEEAKAMMKNETRLTPQQAKAAGFVDVVIPNNWASAIAAMASDFREFKDNVMNFFSKKAVASGPSAKDYALKAGGTLSVAGESLAQGVSATFNGQPAEGPYELGDGTMVTCAGGVVTQVTPPTQAAPQETEAQKLQKQMAQIQEQITALTNAATQAAQPAQTQQATTTEPVKAELEETKIAAKTAQEALAAATKELAELKAQAVGNQSRAPQAQSAALMPYGRAPEAAGLEMTKAFLYENGFEYLTRNPNSPMYGYRPSGPEAATVLTPAFTYTWPGQLTTEIFYKPQITPISLADFFTIDQGIKDRKRYNLVDKLDKILKPYGGCARVFTGSVTVTDKLLQTKEFQVGLEWCKDDFTQQLTGVYNILASEWLKTGNRSFDPTGTPIMAVIDRLATEALARDVFRRVFFAAGNSSDDDYNQIDGFWDKSIDDSGQSNYCVVRANSPVTGGTALGVGTLAPGVALTNLELLYSKSKNILKNQAGKKIWVTRSIWDNYYNSLIGAGAVTEQQFENLTKGLTTLTYKGIPVIPVDLWDQFLEESDNPLFAVTRHLGVMTVKENHILGVENSADLNKLEGWYERMDRKFYMEGDMKFGYLPLHCDLTTIIY